MYKLLRCEQDLFRRELFAFQDIQLVDAISDHELLSFVFTYSGYNSFYKLNQEVRKLLHLLHAMASFVVR